MAGITVDVGVKLNVLQSSLADFQKILGKLEPDASGYKNLSKIISEMAREMEKFQVQTSKGFSSNKQFTQADRSIEKMEETLTRAQLAISNLKFSDIKLDSNQTQAFVDLEQAIVNAETKLDSIKEKTKQGIFSDTTAINTLAQLDKNGITKSFDEIDAIVTRGTKQIEGKIINAEAQVKELRATVSSQKSINARAENLLANGITSDDWGNLLNKTGTGFKAGGKQEFLQILKDQFQVSDADIDEISKLSFGKINEAFKNQKFNNIFDEFKKNFSDNSSNLTNLEDNLIKYKELQQAVGDLYSKMNAAKADGTPLGQGMSDYNAEIERVSQALANLRGQVVQGVSANANFGNSLTAMRGQLQSFTTQLDQANTAFLRLQQQQQTFNSLKTAVVNFMGFNQVLNLTKKAISEAMNHIKELDSVMNGISIVTNMSTADLWNQVDAYSEMAQNYGVTIKGAYEVSQIYYQQGLETNDVLNLTNETLKLSKVSGLDYAQSTDYMTTAIRGFKMEMSEASTVVDVYSNLAASTAVSQEELAVAMSKTASSMESVGSTFQDTSAMIATMVAVTRESATNIGSAMKSIASRYGELTKDPTKLLDSEGEAMSFNKVDAALQSVGISLQTTEHQFRSFTEVITELAEKWDTLDSTQQRYIATQFAGNRQQSRFLALVSNKDLLEENMEVAANSEDIGDLQALKALDSIESKLNQVQVAYQQFYTNLGAEGLWKTLLDGVKNFVNGLNSLPKAFGKIPIGAATVITDAISIIRTVGLNGLSLIAKEFLGQLKNNIKSEDLQHAGQEIGRAYITGFKEGTLETASLKQLQQGIQEAFNDKSVFLGLSQNLKNSFNQAIAKDDISAWFKTWESGDIAIAQLEKLGRISEQDAQILRNLMQSANDEGLVQKLEELGYKAEDAQAKLQQIAAIKISNGMIGLGAALNVVTNALDKTSNSGRIFAGVLMGVSGALKAVGEISKFLKTEGMAFPWMAVAMAAITLINGIATIVETPEETLDRLNKKAEELSNKAKQVKADEKTLQTGIDKVRELEKTRYDSKESAEEYQSAVEDLAESFPELIKGFDEAGNVIIDLDSGEEKLTAARQATAKATYDAAKAEQEAAKKTKENQNKNINEQFNNLYKDLYVGDSNTLGKAFSSDAGVQQQNFFRTAYEGTMNAAGLGILDYSFDNQLITSPEQLFNSLSGILNYSVTEDISSYDKFITALSQGALAEERFFKEHEDLLPQLEKAFGVGDLEVNSTNEVINSFEEIRSLIYDLSQMDDYSTDEAKNKAADLRKKITDFNKVYGKGIFNQLVGEDASISNILDSMSELQLSDKTYQNYTKSSINQWLQLGEAFDDAWINVENNNEALGLLANQLYDIWRDNGKEDLTTFQNSEKAKQAIEDFREGYTSLNEKQQEAFIEMGKASKNYTATEVSDKLKELADDPTEMIDKAVESVIIASFSDGEKELDRVFDYYDQLIKDNRKNEINSDAITDLEGVINETFENSDMSVNFADFIISQFKTINDLSKQGFTSAASTLTNQTAQLLTDIKNLTGSNKSVVTGILNSANLKTKEGIDEAIVALQNSDLDESVITKIVGDLQQQRQQLIDNVALSLNSDLDQLLINAENDSKLLTKVTSGLTIKEANELVQAAKKWGVDLTIGEDLIPNGDKLIASEQAYLDLQRGYSKLISETAKRAEDNLKKAKEIELLSDSNEWADMIGELNEEQIQFLKTQGIQQEEYWEGNKLSDAGLEQVEEMKKNIDQAIINYGAGGSAILASIFEESNWNKGDYTSLMKNGAFSTTNQQTVDTFKKYNQSIDRFFDVEEFNDYLRGATQYNATENPEIKEAVDKARGGVDSFLSGLLSKGIDNFNPTDYANVGIEQSTYKQMVADLRDFNDNYVDFIKTYADLTGKTESEIDALIAQAYSKQNENNVYDALKDIVGSFDQISYEAGQKIARSIDGFEFEEFNIDPITGNLQLSYEKALELLNEGIEDKTSKEYNELRAQIEKKQTDLSTSKILSTIIQNRTKLSEENIASLATILGTSYDEISAIVAKNDDGTYSIDLAEIQTLLNNSTIQVGQSVSQLFTNEIDTIIKSITGITSDQSKGFTDLSSMQKYIQGLRQKGVKLDGKELNFDQLFEYNESLQAYQLTTQGVIAQIASGKAEIDALKEQLKYSTDLKERRDLFEQIKIGEQFISDTVKSFAKAIDIESWIDTDIGSKESIQAQQTIIKAIDDYNAALIAISEKGAKVVGINAQAMLDAIGEGGIGAVTAAEKIADIQGITLSAETIETLYRRQINSYVNAIDTAMAKPGEIVDATTANLIQLSGGEVTQLGTSGQYVVESAANLYEAYNNLLQKMIATGEATLADLNKVQALALENRDGEQQIIDALGDAAGMTFTRFGEILADAGIQLTESMVNDLKTANIIDLIGGNKMKIIDFQAFADLMQWDANSEEYVSAFKSYNDSLIDMNRQAERNILEEAQNVAGAKGGDWVNITQLWDKLTNTIAESTEDSDIMAIAKLRSAIEGYGGQIEDGILKLDDSANIPAIMQEIAQAAAESGGLLSNELAELADAVADALKGYADLINGAIEGSLSNFQAEELQDWATANGIGKLNFTETADGLKIATDQAFELVAALRQVDSMQGKLTFDSLIDSLSEDKGGKFENISKTTAEIAKAQKQIAKNEEEIRAIRKNSEGDIEADKRKINNLINQNKQLKEQIGLYREIQQHQSIDPSQYNFMDRDLPDVMQGPINYWNSVGEAFVSMNEAHKTGKMEIQDFYNIVNEMNNLVAGMDTAVTLGKDAEGKAIQLDGSLESAARVIEMGMGALTNVDGKGVKINLEKLGIDFVSGAEGANKNFADGVNALAESQVAMLDAAIKVLEVVVAMEELGNIEVDGEQGFTFGDVFKIDQPPHLEGTEQEWYEFTDEYNHWRETILDKLNPKSKNYNEDLSAAINSITVNGVGMKKLLEAGADQIKELGMSQQEYFGILEGFVKAAQSGDYDLDTIQDTVWETLKNAGLTSDLTIDVGDRTIVVSGGTTVSINWSDPDTESAMNLLRENKEETEEELKQKLKEAFVAYQTGEATQLQTISYFVTQHEIKLDDDGNIILPDGSTVKKGSWDFVKTLAELSLKDHGLEPGIREYHQGENGPEIKIYSTTKIGEIDVEVYADGDGNLHYISKVTGGDYSSVDELLQAEYEVYLNDVYTNGLELQDFEAWAYQTYKIHVNTTTKFTGKDGSEITDPGNDPGFQQAARKFLSQSQESIQEQLNNLETDGAGHYTLKLPGGESITVDASGPEEAAEKLEQQIKELYAPVADSVAAGITQAFTSTDGENGNAIQTAISTAIQTALGIGQQNSEGTNGIPINGITLAPQGLTINLAEVGDPVISGAEEESSEVSIPEVTLVPDNLVLQLKGLEPTPESGKKKQEIEGGEVESKPTKISLNLEGTTPTTEGTANTQEVPYGAITLKPASITVDTSGFDATSVAQEIATAIQTELSKINLTPPKVGSAPSGGQESDKGSESSGDTTSTSTITVTIDDAEANSKLDALLEKANSEDNQITVNALTDTAEDAVSTLQEHANAPANKTVNASTSMAEHKVSTLHSNAEKSATKTVNADTERAMKLVGTLDTNANAPATKTVSIAAEHAQSWKDFLKDLGKDYSITVKVKAKKTGGDWPKDSNDNGATGNVSLAKGNVGAALARGRTLMGELGPELVVSKGHYFVVGDSGPEMVNLAPDAIVFNHIQTRQLLANGKTGTHGKPVTNERKATSLATGNVSGPAMSSASAALAALKQLRAMWASLMNASLADMGGMPRGSGGGGGGGGGSGETKEAVEGINAEVERWYNWLKLIEATQNEINKLTKKYDLLTTKGAETSDLSDNLKEQAKQLQIQLSTAHQLRIEQENYRKDLIKTANQGLFSAFYRADPKTGQVYLANDEAFMDYVKKQGLDNKYMTDGTIEQGKKIKVKYSSQEKTRIGSVARKAKKDNIGKEGYKSLSDEEKQFYTKSGKLKSAAKIGSKLIKDQPTSVKIYREGGIKTGLDFMDELFGQKDKAGNNRHTAEEQLALIKAMGFYTDDLLAGVDTSQDDWEAQVVQNFKDKIDSDKAEIEALNQSIQEQAEAELEYKKQIQEINNELIEMASHHQGVTEHLESWYEWSRKIVENQHQLNILTQQYNRLQNSFGDQRKNQYKNLVAQIKQTTLQLKNTQEEKKLRKEAFKEMAKKAGANFKGNKIQAGGSLYGGIYTVDENGNLVYNKEGLTKAGFSKEDNKQEISKKEYKELSNIDKAMYQKKGNTYVLRKEVTNQKTGQNTFVYTKRTAVTDESGRYVKDLSLSSSEKQALKLKDTLTKKPSKKLRDYYTENNDGTWTLNEEGMAAKDAAQAKQKVYSGGMTYEEFKNQKDKMNKNKKFKNLKDKLTKKPPKKLRDYYTEKSDGTWELNDTGKKGRADYNTAKEMVDAYKDESSLIKYVEEKGYANLDVSSPEKFLRELTAVDGNNNSIFDARQQAEILIQAGLGEEMQFVNGKKYFDSLETAKPEQLEAAAAAYLEYIKETPEAWAEAKDKIDENVETEEELKTRISELNNQIRELYKPTEGITKHLESWYNWARMTIDAQKKLNQLQAQYANLEKIQNQGSTTQKKIKNLQDQLEQTRISIEGNKGEQASRLNNLNKERKKITGDSFFSKIFEKNTDGSIAYRGDKIGVKGQKIKVTEIERDENGREVRYGKDDQGNYTVRLDPNSDDYNKEGEYRVKTTGKQYKFNKIFKNVMDENGEVSVQDMIETITKEVSPGVSEYSLEAQTAMFQAIFGEDFNFENVAKFARLPNWEDATLEQQNEALKSYLEYMSDAVENTNALKDAWEDSVTEGINLNGQAIDLNNQIYELLKPIEGVTDHLEEWYEWTRKTTAAQQQLNKLQNEYNNLQKQRALGQQVKNDKGKFKNITDAKYIENLQKQGIQIQNSIISNAAEQVEKERLWKKERNELVSKDEDNPFKDIFTLDENNNVVYGQKFDSSGLNGEKTYKAIKVRNGQQVKQIKIKGGKNLRDKGYTYEEWIARKAYQQAKNENNIEEIQRLENIWNQASWDIIDKPFNLYNFVKTLDVNQDDNITQEEFFSGLTQKKNGKYKYTLQEQTAALEAAGYTNRVAKYYGQGPWETLDEEQRHEAVQQFLSAVSTEAGRINQLRDDWEQSVIEGTALEGNLLDINQQIEEIATSSTAVANSFEKWYSWTQKIARVQNALNLLTAENSNLEKKRVNNGTEIAKNLRNQYKNNKDNLENINGTNPDPKVLDGYYKQRLAAYEQLLNEDNRTTSSKHLFKTYTDENGLTYLDFNDSDHTMNMARGGRTKSGNTVEDYFNKYIAQSVELDLDKYENYQYDENGILKTKNREFNDSTAYISKRLKTVNTTEDILSILGEKDINGQFILDRENQFAWIRALGLEDYMKFNDGVEVFKNGIDNATKEERDAGVEAFFKNVYAEKTNADKEISEIVDLKKSAEDSKSALIDIENQIQDNEIELENKLMQAIEDRDQFRIDELNKQKEMLEDAAEKFLDGLSKQLDKEKDMYERQEKQDELIKLQRQLAILQRSGGSSSQIRSLQEQIRSQQKDQYFDERQQQIDAIKEASDAEIERLDRQIQIAEETLTYAKENGLYWNEVRSMMENWSSDKILAFINENSAERRAQSSLQVEVSISEDGKIASLFTEFRDTPAFKQGGLIDYTGPAWVDGSSAKPESILTASQTDFLRNQLLNNLLDFSYSIDQFTKAALNTNTLSSVNENTGINIGQLDFVMKVDSIANDYDAKRAGQQAFEEMVRIARKSGNRSISRR